MVIIRGEKKFFIVPGKFSYEQALQECAARNLSMARIESDQQELVIRKLLVIFGSTSSESWLALKKIHPITMRTRSITDIEEALKNLRWHDNKQFRINGSLTKENISFDSNFENCIGITSGKIIKLQDYDCSISKHVLCTKSLSSKISSEMLKRLLFTRFHFNRFCMYLLLLATRDFNFYGKTISRS